MKKIVLIALLGLSGIAHAAYVAVDASPVRRDIVAEDPVMTGRVISSQPIVTDSVVVEGPGVTPADRDYYYTPYGNRPVANTVSGAANVAADAVAGAGDVAASVIPF